MPRGLLLLVLPLRFSSSRRGVGGVGGSGVVGARGHRPGEVGFYAGGGEVGILETLRVVVERGGETADGGALGGGGEEVGEFVRVVGEVEETRGGAGGHDEFVVAAERAEPAVAFGQLAVFASGGAFRAAADTDEGVVGPGGGGAAGSAAGSVFSSSSVSSTISGLWITSPIGCGSSSKLGGGVGAVTLTKMVAVDVAPLGSATV